MSGEIAAAFVRALGAAAARRMSVVEAARRLGLEGYVRRHAGPDLPAITEDASARRLAGRLYESLLLEAAGEASAVFTARGIPHFVAKGVAFLGVLYQPGDREVADIDLWVPPDQESRARRALSDVGFVEAGAQRQGGPDGLRPGRVFERGEGTGLTAVSVDLHWAVESVTRIIPRSAGGLPPEVWRRLEQRGGFPVPAPADHAALLVHHLVHHDLLHVRGLLDLALLWGERACPRELFEPAARQLGVWRAARFMAELLRRELGITGAASVPPPPRGVRAAALAWRMTLSAWLTLALAAPEVDYREMTLRRLLRRALLLDRGGDVVGLLADGVWPPEAHVRWRWPETGSAASARWHHARHLLRKLAGRALP